VKDFGEKQESLKHARYHRFQEKTVKDPSTGKRMNGAILRQPMVLFRFRDGLLHGGTENGGIAVESGTDGYYEKWENGKLKEAGTLMEDIQGRTWRETWEKGVPSGYWEKERAAAGETIDEKE
jgi:hypothetical protein